MSLKISSITRNVNKKLSHMKEKYGYEPKGDIVGIISKKCPYFGHFDMKDCELEEYKLDSLHETYYWLNYEKVKKSEATLRLCITDKWALDINYYLKGIYE